MNRLEILKYAGFGLLGFYLYRKIENRGMSPELGALINRSGQLVDQFTNGIQDPILREKINDLAKHSAKIHLMNKAAIRDVTPIEGA